VSAAVTVGVDVGGTSTRIVVFDADGRDIASRGLPTPHGGDALTRLLAYEIVELAAPHGRLLHVGVGVPGRVTGRSTVAMALNIGIGEGYDLAGALRAALHVPVVVENDVNAAAVGAYHHLGGGGDLAYLSVGTGFAAGLVVAGELHRGASGTAGEIGHLPIPGDDTPCPCGQRGCIEAVVAGSVLSAAAADLGVGTGAGALLDAADRGDARAAAVAARSLDALAWVCQLAVVMLDVELVVLGGGVSDLGDRLVEPIRERLVRIEASSPLIAGIAPSRRLRLAPQRVAIGAAGADRLARHWVAACS